MEEGRAMGGCGERKPVWWGLYVIVALLLAAVGLVEVRVEAGFARQLLEVGSVVAGFALIRLWLRGNRAALDLAQGRRGR
jgi:hypothetical protein